MTDSVAIAMDRVAQIELRVRQVDPTWSSSLAHGPTSVTGVEPATTTPFAAALAEAGSVPRAGGARRLPTVFASGSAQAAAALPGDLAGSSGIAPGDRLVDPLPGARVTQAYGPTSLSLEPPATVNGVDYAHFHDGLDLAAPLGQTVRAAADGRVTFAGRYADGAVVVRIRHGDGSETEYGHLQAGLELSVGDPVKAGDPVGRVGVTGNTTGPHLHFELRSGGQPIDPEPWLQAGRLPGAPVPAVAPADAPPTAGASSAAALASFDAVADKIPFATEIRAAAVKAGVDPLLLASLVRAESGFRPRAVSSAGALGLTQLMPDTARGMHVADPFDPADNVAAGARYLANNLRIFGRVDLALAAYQAGKGAVRAAGGIPDSPTTHNYIDTILRTWSGYLEGAS
jgi:hypothetical protein